MTWVYRYPLTPRNRPDTVPSMAFGIPLSLSKLREIAVEASCDPRTVAHVIKGERVLPLPEERVRAALLRRGIKFRDGSKNTHPVKPAT